MLRAPRRPALALGTASAVLERVAEPEYEVAVLIASRNGSATIADTVRSAVSQADVYVVSDASDDETVRVAQEAGARVLDLSENVGKPAALRRGFDHFDLGRYAYVSVLDDDTLLAADYFQLCAERMTKGVAVVSGRIISLWQRKHSWNPFIAMRAFTYWSYQVTIKRGQEALRVVNVICGANSLFRSSVLDDLLSRPAPYAIDDMFWMAELARGDMGRVAYEPQAKSWTIDPHDLRSWYKQTVRWSWGQFQSIRGHRLGVRRSWFDLAYLMLLVDWFMYLAEPFVLPAILYFQPFFHTSLTTVGLFYVGTTALWLAVAATALKTPRLLVFLPVILILDLTYRVTMIHAIIKTVREPRVDQCVWESPERFGTYLDPDLRLQGDPV